MNEAETRAEHVDPALKAAGWGVVEGSRVRREVPITGVLQGRGRAYALWSAPDTRKKLLQGLAERGFGREQLAEMQKIIDAEKSDLFDVLAHVAYARPPVTREVRAAGAKMHIDAAFNAKQRLFLDFVLEHYVSVGGRRRAGPGQAHSVAPAPVSQFPCRRFGRPWRAGGDWPSIRRVSEVSL